ncbi:hypothetical protein OGAPHI_004535 [Ogataea philodendri]|uniref:Uncharacterized protein n=1 Tax=Ogataea philodendri TaxID=1378263 RepID=A0A9P8T523_9ASCO|nr:uncharacterized protein OGAPHI_004535 [Ogataea philodendri]KAH3666346.1 hypothetical protein OGAPHI_004535 [Ogataea philodendri]
MTYSNDTFVTPEGGAWVFKIGFLVTTAIHFGLAIYTKTWFECWYIIGGILEAVGYFCINTDEGGQSLEIYLAPIFMAATVYMCFGRVISSLEANKLALISGRKLTALFVIGDILCFFTQCAGIVLQYDFNNLETIGKIIAIISFTLQLVLFTFFLANAIVVHRRLILTQHPRTLNAKIQWPTYFKANYVVIFLFFVRIIFRVIEYAQGLGYIFFHTIFIYCFDATPLFAASLVLIAVYPPLAIVRKEPEPEELTASSEEPDTESKVA